MIQRSSYFSNTSKNGSSFRGKLPYPNDLSDLSFSRDLVSSSQDLTTDGTQITEVP